MKLSSRDKEEEEESFGSKAEEFIKSSIFGVYFMVLKENEGNSLWTILIMMIIETIQLLSLIFSSDVKDESLNG
jgi:hypothetical protein